MAVSELLRNKLIVTYRLQPQYASVLGCLLVSEMATYATLAGFVRRYKPEDENWNAEAAIKAFISRMRTYRPFKDGDFKIHNASNVGYYLDSETKKKIFEAIKEQASGSV